MKVRLFLLACVLASIFSCQKGSQNEAVTPPVLSVPMVDVQLKLAGDIVTNESPLGRKAKGLTATARTLNDSTLYIVEVGYAGYALYKGLFNRPDSIVVRIPASGQVTVAAVAIRRGSGPGLFYSWYYPNGLYYPYPIDDSLTNRMDTAYGYFRNAIDTLSYLPVFNVWDTTQISRTLHSELDCFVGALTFTGSTAPAVISIPMRRPVFGIRYNVANFNSGRLIASFNALMPPKYLTPVEAAYGEFIYTANELKWADSLRYSAVPVNLQWERPDGSIVPLGQKTIGFRRNVLTTLNVAIPSNGSSVINPIPTDTTWTGSQNINF